MLDIDLKLSEIGFSETSVRVDGAGDLVDCFLNRGRFRFEEISLHESRDDQSEDCTDCDGCQSRDSGGGGNWPEIESVPPADLERFSANSFALVFRIHVRSFARTVRFYQSLTSTGMRCVTWETRSARTFRVIHPNHPHREIVLEGVPQ